MPVSIPPLSTNPGSHLLSRRGFLGSALAGAAATALGGRVRLFAAETPVWALLSDTHIHASVREENQGINMASNLLQVVAEILRAKPGTAVIDGDLARLDGKPGDYATFLEILKPLRAAGIPIHTTLGNHDDRNSFLEVLGSRRESGVELSPTTVQGKVCRAIEVDGYRWLLLDSLDEVNKVPGLLGGAQTAWLKEELDREPEIPALLFVHHNVTADNSSLKDSSSLLDLIRPRRQVKAVFFGHTHVWKRSVVDGIHLVNLPAVGYAFQPGEPMGWVRGTPLAGGLQIELRSLDGKHPHHGQPFFLPWRTKTETPEAF